MVEPHNGENSGYEEQMRRYLEEFDILDDDEVLVLYGVPDVPGDNISEP